jgi:hypothetical protein
MLPDIKLLQRKQLHVFFFSEYSVVVTDRIIN